MCITYSDQASSEMIVSRILGEDGKPVRIKVECPETIKRLLKRKAKRMEKKKRKQWKKREEKGGRPQAVEEMIAHRILVIVKRNP